MGCLLSTNRVEKVQEEEVGEGVGFARKLSFYVHSSNEDFTFIISFPVNLIISSKDSPNKAQHLGATILASKFAANTRRGVVQKVQFADTASSSLKMPELFKPNEPDFSEEV
ncbi:unnamed protein product [Fraxinus pennsylvanica]|uniref:Uncharacterized protein n=1 Tax=Fraxinus pennsylvanica TaxID=56036 RepID=A0AAD1YMS6_9LAMI|nr:unnamed protein product [Fraxinus pennsylvanica]